MEKYYFAHVYVRAWKHIQFSSKDPTKVHSIFAQIHTHLSYIHLPASAPILTFEHRHFNILVICMNLGCSSNAAPLPSKCEFWSAQTRTRPDSDSYLNYEYAGAYRPEYIVGDGCVCWRFKQLQILFIIKHSPSTKSLSPELNATTMAHKYTLDGHTLRRIKWTSDYIYSTWTGGLAWGWVRSG